MQQQKVNPSELSRRMSTSRNQVYRLLDENDTGVTFVTLSTAARALDTSFMELLAVIARKAIAKRKPAGRRPSRPRKAVAKPLRNRD